MIWHASDYSLMCQVDGAPLLHCNIMLKLKRHAPPVDHRSLPKYSTCLLIVHAIEHFWRTDRSIYRKTCFACTLRAAAHPHSYSPACNAFLLLTLFASLAILKERVWVLVAFSYTLWNYLLNKLKQTAEIAP